jgi:alkanesulfonate monooxygenase SsuD/methylene tetrahydromethanopterin reductase-like flavin-dependent oxidoreductase (luciferase family)
LHVTVHMSPQSRGDAEDLATIEELVEQARAADAAGISAISLTEHHLAGFNTYCDPFLMGSYLAGMLERAHLAIHVVQMSLQHPVRIAEHCNMLDLLMKGRLMVALAPGSVRQIELDAFGVDVDSRAPRTAQRIEAMLRAWGWRDGDDPVDVSTDFDTGTLAGRLMPSSYRKPHPLIGRATGTDATIVETARRGWPVVLGAIGDPESDRRQVDLYSETLEHAGHDAATTRDCLAWLGFLTLICVGESEGAAMRRLDEFIESGGAGPIVTARDAGTRPSAAEWQARQRQRANLALAGTPEVIVEHLLGFRDVGVEHARVALVEVPGRAEANLEAFQLFLEEVLPHLDPQPLPDPSRTAFSDSARGA